MNHSTGDPHFRSATVGEVPQSDARQDPSSLSDARVTIVGLGLMGASLAGALRGHCQEVVGVARRTATTEAALARGLVDRATLDLAAGVSQSDVVILATPVRVILRQIPEIGPLLPEGCLLLDLGSAMLSAEMAFEGFPFGATCCPCPRSHLGFRAK